MYGITKALIAVAVVAFGISEAKSQDEPKFFLKSDGTVEKRLAINESKVAALEKKVAELEKKLGNSTKTYHAEDKVVTEERIRYSVCTNGKCTIYETNDPTKVPANATILQKIATATAVNDSPGSPCPTGPCGDACACGSPPAMAVASTSDGGWYLGKNLGRGRGRLRGGCSSCGGQ